MRGRSDPWGEGCGAGADGGCDPVHAFRLPGLGGRDRLGAVAGSDSLGNPERRSRARDCRAEAQGRRRRGVALAAPP